MHEKLELFLDSVCAHIKYAPAHKEIREELTSHVYELRDEFMDEMQRGTIIIETGSDGSYTNGKQSGCGERALDMAINAMGNCEEIGRKLNKQHKPETDWVLIGLTALIALIGGVVTYASRNYSFNSYINGYEELSVDFNRYLISAALGTAVMIGLYFFDYTRLKKLAWLFFLPALVFAVFSSGRSFSEFKILLLLVPFAGFIESAKGRGYIGIFKLVVIALLPVAVNIIKAPLFSQSVTLITVYGVLIIAAVIRGHFGGNRKNQLIILGILASLGIMVFMSVCFSSSYRLARLGEFFAPNKDIHSTGYLPWAAGEWLKSSEIIGGAISAGNMKGNAGDYLPQLASDYSLVNVFVTLGSAAGILLIVFIAAYITRMIFAVLKIKDSFGFYLSFTAVTLLTLQFITGVMINFNLFPTTSVYIPFISYGEGGFVVSMALIGLILSVWRRRKILGRGHEREPAGKRIFL